MWSGPECLGLQARGKQAVMFPWKLQNYIFPPPIPFYEAQERTTEACCRTWNKQKSSVVGVKKQLLEQKHLLCNAFNAHTKEGKLVWNCCDVSWCQWAQWTPTYKWKLQDPSLSHFTSIARYASYVCLWNLLCSSCSNLLIYVSLKRLNCSQCSNYLYLCPRLWHSQN